MPLRGAEWRDGAAAAAAGLRQLSAAAPCLPEGAAVIFDARCLHRGLPNRSAGGTDSDGEGRARAVLVFRYDAPDTPPPGHTTATAAVAAATGAALLALAQAGLAEGPLST